MLGGISLLRDPVDPTFVYGAAFEYRFYQVHPLSMLKAAIW